MYPNYVFVYKAMMMFHHSTSSFILHDIPYFTLLSSTLFYSDALYSTLLYSIPFYSTLSTYLPTFTHSFSILHNSTLLYSTLIILPSFTHVYSILHNSTLLYSTLLYCRWQDDGRMDCSPLQWGTWTRFQIETQNGFYLMAK